MEYSQEEWMIPARDTNGFSNRTYFRLSPAMERAMSVVIQNKSFPYRTTSDLIRHALYRHLGFLHKLEPTMPKHYYGALDAIAEVVRDDEHRTEMESVFDTLGKRIEHHLNIGDLGEAYRLAALVKSRIAVLEPSAWKDRYQNKFVRQFKGLMIGRREANPVVEMPKRLTAGSGVDDEDDND